MKLFLTGLFIFLISIMIYSYDLNVEFQGDDDALAAGHMVNFSKRLDNPPPLQLEDIQEWLGRWGYNFFLRQHHSPLTSLYCGLFYWAANTVGIPISYQFLSLPLAAAAALGVVFFYRLLVRLQLPNSLTWALTLMFMLSPVYVINTRALHSYYMAVVPLIQLIALVIVTGTVKGKYSPWLLGFMSAVQVLSDILFMVSMSLTIAVFLWADGWIGPRGALKKLAKPGVLIPPAVALSGLVFCTILKFTDPSLGPNDITPLSWLLSKTDKVAVGPAFSIWDLPVTLSFLFGELAAPLLITVIIVAVWRRRRLTKGIHLTYSLMALAAFGSIFYFLSHTQSTPFLRQAYLLIPWSLLIALTVKAVISARPVWRTGAAVILWLTVVSCAAGTAAAVWAAPTSISNNIFAIARSYNGVKNFNYGTKAAGMVIRRLIESQLTGRPAGLITVEVINCPPKRLSSLIMFTGMAQRGVYYQKKYHCPPLTLKILSQAARQGGKAELPGEIVVDLGSVQSNSSREKRLTTIEIVDHDRLLWSIKVYNRFPIGTTGKRTESLDRLEREFDEQFSGLYDLFEWA